MRNHVFCIYMYAKTKGEISCKLTGKLVGVFVCAIQIHVVQASIYLLGCTAWFMTDLVGNPKDWFSRDKAQLY